jgi:hypothetical protein
VYFTIDGGAHWTQLKSGLPGVPVHDIQIQARANDLVLGTHGRGIYILDDLTPLENLAKAKQSAVAHLFAVQDALLFQPNASRNSGMGTRGFTGQNPEPGPHITYAVAEPATNVSLSILDASGTVVREILGNKQPGMYRTTWDMRVGPPLTGPVDTTNGGRGRGAGTGRGGAATDSAGRGGFGGGGGGGGGRGGAPDNTFPAMPGRYTARLTVATAKGAPTVLEQSFALTKDPMVLLSDAELKGLYAFRLDVMKTQRALRERQAQLDTAQRTLAAAKRAADSAGTKITPELKTQIAAVEKELADITREIGTPNAGRGGGGGGGGGFGGFGGFGGAPVAATGGAFSGTGGAGRGGRGGGGLGRAGGPITQSGAPTAERPSGASAPPVAGGADEEQNPTAPTTPQNIQAKLGTTTEMLNVTFNPNPEQKKTLQTLPAELQKQGDRVKKVTTDQLPALLKALKEAGVEVKTP